MIRVPDHRIIVGIDGSTHARKALEWALADAAARHSGICLVHAVISDAIPTWQLDAARDEGAEILAEEARFALALAPEVAVDTYLVDDTPVPALLARGAGAEMIVVGHRGRGGFASLTLGSVGVQLASHTPCPLVVVRSGKKSEYLNSARVVIGLDVSASSQATVEFAFEEATLHECELVAVHAFVAQGSIRQELWAEVLPPPTDRFESLREKMSESLAGWRDRYPHVKVVERIVVGKPDVTLIEESEGARLVVVGSRGSGGFAGLRLGSTSQRLLHHSRCPVAVVP